jgi:hypothetical protein
MNALQPAASFNEKVAYALQNVTYRIARTAAERDCIYALRYRGYLRDGGIGPNPTGRFTDSWDETDNALLLGMYVRGELASTVRLHIAGPGGGRIPAMDTFPDSLAPYIAAGQTILDPTRFVIDENFARIGPEMPFLTLRMIAMAAEYFAVDIILATVRTEHAIMYKRICGHRPISEPRAYPLLSKQILCAAVETATMCATAYPRHPFLASTPAERAAVFG